MPMYQRYFKFLCRYNHMKAYQVHIKYTAWEVSAFGVFLVRIFPHSDQKNSEYGHFSHSGTQHTISQEPTLVLNSCVLHSHKVFSCHLVFHELRIVSSDTYLGDCVNSFKTEVPIRRNQSIDFQGKSMNWVLYDRDLRGFLTFSGGIDIEHWLELGL